MRAAARASTLYELSDQYAETYYRIADAADDQRDALLAELGAIEGTIAVKADSIAVIAVTEDSRAAAEEDEAARLIAKAKRRRAHAEWCRGYLLREMTAQNNRRIETGRFTIRVQNNSSPTVTVTEEAAIPAEFWRIVPASSEPSKVAIGRHFTATGEIVPGVAIQVGQHLRIE